MLGSEGFIVPLIWTRRSSSKKEANINNIQAAAASEVKKMAATSSSVPFYGIREEEQYNAQPQAPPPPSQQQQATAAPPKKKRNLPGNPNPDAEVIALSPKTLLATNRFICEVCNKGFQREQNLQLHRRGHNLPWKLKQKNPKEVRRRVYICPEPTCVHHEPSRALGDLTGIKKHFCRKHGEKKWKCDKCSKRYAVQSDWKAHSKTCGTREYRCDCGTLFSRRDSFITHRAFCDALAQESARLPNAMNSMGGHLYGSNPGLVNLSLPLVNPQFSSLQDQTVELSGNGNTMQFDHLTLPSYRQSQQLQQGGTFYIGGGSGGGGSGGGGGSTQTINDDTQLLQSKPFHGLMQLQDLHPNATNASAAAAANIFNLNINNNSSSNNNAAMNQSSNLLMSDQFNNINVPSGRDEPISATFAGNLMSNHNFDPNMSSIPPHMSATALLQKAAQMGATSSGGGGGASSLLKGFGSFYSGDAKNEGHFHDLMNSWANGGGNEQETGYGGFGHGINVSNMINESKLQRNLSVGGLSGSDRLSTRDFLGVGNLMRSMHGGGMTKRDHQQQHLGIDMGSLDSELKSGSSSRSFAGGTLQ